MHMAAAAKLWTVDDLATLPEDGNRYEVIDGELLVTPAPTLDHQRAIGKLYRLLAAYLEQQHAGEVIFAPADILFSSHRGVQPDVFVLPWAEGNRPKSFAEVGRLLLAAEVLSPSTARADRVTKRKLYREENVPEYWIVDLEAQVFERSTPRDERIEVVADRLEWQPEGASAPLIVDLQRFFDDL